MQEVQKEYRELGPGQKKKKRKKLRRMGDWRKYFFFYEKTGDGGMQDVLRQCKPTQTSLPSLSFTLFSPLSSLLFPLPSLHSPLLPSKPPCQLPTAHQSGREMFQSLFQKFSACLQAAGRTICLKFYPPLLSASESYSIFCLRGS